MTTCAVCAELEDTPATEPPPANLKYLVAHEHTGEILERYRCATCGTAWERYVPRGVERAAPGKWSKA
jgi:hypothetical protein